MSSLDLLPESMRRTDSKAFKYMERPASTSSRFVLEKISCHAGLALCSKCKHKFDFKKHNYVPTTRWGRVIGDCDGCKEYTKDQIFFIHELYVSDSGGRIKHGQVYRPL